MWFFSVLYGASGLFRPYFFYRDKFPSLLFKLRALLVHVLVQAIYSAISIKKQSAVP
jgi:hypothetical protein